MNPDLGMQWPAARTASCSEHSSYTELREYMRWLRPALVCVKPAISHVDWHNWSSKLKQLGHALPARMSSKHREHTERPKYGCALSVCGPETCWHEQQAASGVCLSVASASCSPGHKGFRLCSRASLAGMCRPHQLWGSCWPDPPFVRQMIPAVCCADHPNGRREQRRGRQGRSQPAEALPQPD